MGIERVKRIICKNYCATPKGVSDYI